jgi:alginate O-acetyltransferase complex protein AlgI
MLYETAGYLPFLLLTIALYWSVPVSRRRYVLTLASIALVGYLSWRGTLAFLSLAVFVYCIGQRLRSESPSRRRTALMTLGFVVPLAYLCTFKYLPEYAPPIRAMLESMTAGSLLLPLGISYFTFKFLHYIIDSRRGTLPRHDLWDFLCYMSLFSTFAAGPIERLNNLQPQLRAPRLDAAGVSLALQRILSGVIKKVIIADTLVLALQGLVADVPRDYSDASTHAQIVYVWCRFLYIYFDFSGYSDIAIGTSLLFGLRVMENFNWPILAGNISEFWRSWHMSLASWCRDYIYFPVFGATRNPKIAVLVTMIVLGYWHGPEAKWLLWGAWHGSGLVVWQLWQTYKRTRPALLRVSQGRLYRLAAIALTVNFAALGSVWPASRTTGDAVKFLYYLVVP